MKFVVVRRKRGAAPLAILHADTVDARTEQEAVQAVLEGDRWEIDDGGYDVWIVELDEMRRGVATRSTEVTTNVTLNEEAQDAAA